MIVLLLLPVMDSFHFFLMYLSILLLTALGNFFSFLICGSGSGSRAGKEVGGVDSIKKWAGKEVGGGLLGFEFHGLYALPPLLVQVLFRLPSLKRRTCASISSLDLFSKPLSVYHEEISSSFVPQLVWRKLC